MAPFVGHQRSQWMQGIRGSRLFNLLDHVVQPVNNQISPETFSLIPRGPWFRRSEIQLTRI